jgi:hypothetical protein
VDIHEVLSSDMALDTQAKRAANALVDVRMAYDVRGDVGEVAEGVCLLAVVARILDQVLGEIIRVSVVEAMSVNVRSSWSTRMPASLTALIQTVSEVTVPVVRLVR